jgi:hypothetical protein
MAAVPVTFQGILFFSDLGVGGGPMPGGPSVSHPIAPGGPPPGIWPSPGYPAHPIAPGGPPPGIWPSPGVPTHPIVLPPNAKPEVLENWEVKAGWSEQSGWVIAIVPTEEHPGTPTPSA